MALEQKARDQQFDHRDAKAGVGQVDPVNLAISGVAEAGCDCIEISAEIPGSPVTYRALVEVAALPLEKPEYPRMPVAELVGVFAHILARAVNKGQT